VNVQLDLNPRDLSSEIIFRPVHVHWDKWQKSTTYNKSSDYRMKSLQVSASSTAAVCVKRHSAQFSTNSCPNTNLRRSRRDSRESSHSYLSSIIRFVEVFCRIGCHITSNV
jgi:hypothetical protein